MEKSKALVQLRIISDAIARVDPLTNENSDKLTHIYDLLIDLYMSVEKVETDGKE